MTLVALSGAFARIRAGLPQSPALGVRFKYEKQILQKDYTLSSVLSNQSSTGS